jgi:uncharacterized membrane protein
MTRTNAACGAALGSVLAAVLAAVAVPASADEAKADKEKCYGISLAG